MSFLAKIRDGLASAQLEISRHVDAASIHQLIENAHNSVQAGAAGLGHLRYLANGYATTEQQRNTHNATKGQDGCPHIEVTMTGNEQGYSGVKRAFPGADAADEQCTCACSCDDGPQSSKANEDGSNNGFMDSARRLKNAAWENPMMAAGAVAAGAGVLAVAAPVVVTAPILGIAGAAGFTPAGIAASSLAAGIHAGIGSVAAGSAFATVQSAAMGGYGLAVLTGGAQAAGGAVAMGGGLVTLMSRKPQCEQQSGGQSEGEQPVDEEPVNEQPSSEKE